ncbi:MAG: PAS domain-containing protein [Candidatus Nanopelagicales bacterium]
MQWVSPSIRRILGREPEEVEGRLLDLIHRDDLEGVLNLHAAILAGEEDGSVRFRLRSKGGGWSWFEGTARAVRDDAGVLDSLVVFSHDISAQVDYENALADSERRYRLLAEHATDVVYRTRLDGTTEWISEGLTKILGFTLIWTTDPRCRTGSSASRRTIEPREGSAGQAIRATSP